MPGFGWAVLQGGGWSSDVLRYGSVPGQSGAIKNFDLCFDRHDVGVFEFYFCHGCHKT